MSNPAWMPLHIDAYIADTDHLTAAEHGAYMLLIMKYWREGGLPSDENIIRRLAKLTPDQWAESRDILAAFFEDGWTIAPGCAAHHATTKPFLTRPAIPQNIRRMVFERDGNSCSYCGDDDGPFELDHRIPWSQGGPHSVENLAVACRCCNRSKGTLTADQWQAVLQ